MDDAYLRVQQVEKSYTTGATRQTVLRGISLTIQRGERVALLGQSGSGKSTLLNLIAGIDTFDNGEIIVDTQAMSRLSEKQRTQFRRQHVGYIYQSFNLIQTLSAIENIQLPLQLNGQSGQRVQRAAAAMLERVGLAQRANAFPDQLSGGEQQRVAIARAMVHRPSLVLADEHTGNLDADTGQRMMQLFNDIAQETNQTVVMVTHSNAVAATASRVLSIKDGAISPSDNSKDSGLAW